tara:strand:+ start:1755 stop:2681 length:927 start_codon:yes stop_codon:yes gene_type:complete
MIDIDELSKIFSLYKKKFGIKVQKFSIDAGFTCPNQDGTKGVGGCTYCNNNSFNPKYCKPKKSVNTQINEGISFFSKKYKKLKYLAYFQAYTNTYAKLNQLKKIYNEALNHKSILGLIIATRPDCISVNTLNFLEKLVKNGFYIKIEYGIESTIDRTLNLINSCQTYSETINAFKISKGRGIDLGGHLILGLPKESKEDMLSHSEKISTLPINSLKIHHLQIIKNTMMAYQFKKDKPYFKFLNLDEYIDLVVDFLERLRPDIMIERFFSESPKEILIYPKYGIKNYQLATLVEKRLKERNTYQGKLIS